MMKPYNGAESKKTTTREQLPAGGYVCQIMNAEVADYSWGSMLVLSVDVAEGEHKGFFAEDYRAQQYEDKKWRGTFRLSIPKGDGSEKDGWSVKSFNNFIACLEESNEAKKYHWNWDEAGLKGLTIGLLFRNEEWEWQDKTGWRTAACTAVSADDIRTGKFKMPKDKPLKNKTAAAIPAAGAWSEESDDSDLPWN